MNRLNDYRNYLNDEGEIDEDLVREDLAADAESIDSEIAVRLEHRLECEREIVNDDGSTTFLSAEELEDMRDAFEEEIRAEVEEEDEADLEDAVTDKMNEFQEAAGL